MSNQPIRRLLYVCFWLIAARRTRIAGCECEKLAKCHDRLLPTQSRRWTNNCEVKIGLSYEWVTGPIGTFSVRHKSVINPFDLLDLMGIESQIPMFGYQQEPLRSSQENATEIPLIGAE